jgi:hypothetical protein
VNRKITSAVVYAATALALAAYFDAVYGAGRVVRGVWLIHIATAGAVLLAAACILSLFSLRAGVACALAGGLLSWPQFGVATFGIPWRSIVEILPYAYWLELLSAILALAVCSVYSVTQVVMLSRGYHDKEPSKTGFRLVVALVYGVGIILVGNWRAICYWLFRLRYGR